MNFASSSNLKILTNDNFDIWYDQLRQVLYANKIGLLQDPQERTGGSKAADDHELSADQKASADGQLKAQRTGEDGEQAEAKAIYLLNQTIGEDDQRYVLNQPTLSRSSTGSKAEISRASREVYRRNRFAARQDEEPPIQPARSQSFRLLPLGLRSLG